MVFNFYSNSFSQLSKGFAKGLFIIGLLLIGFGILVWVFKEVLAIIAAAIFMAIGAVCCLNAIKIFFLSWKSGRKPDDGRSDNVKIHIE
ncbi:MAG: hypothetical protein A2Y10_13435 [Planctomycetes bacterium GWF2_41_51]|nr:MAG: hypothetical protein A2Y10_13435 [Planctomycetes bacterium GWF2_41_51]HBG26159.1 hypothetical protein [Phycisphaerales bacterium]